MFISEIEVANYRNIKSGKVVFAKPCTFIVGENNLGKTNLIRLLHSIFNRSKLEEHDFNDPTQSVVATMRISLNTFEIGLFNDVADPDDTTKATIRVEAEDHDADLQFTHVPTGETISSTQIRRLCFFLYESLNSDSRSLNYDTDRGVGRVLTKGLVLYQENRQLTTLSFFDNDKLDDLVKYLNETLGKISILSSYGIHAGVDTSEKGALGSVVTLTDGNNLHFKRASSGVQYVALAVMQILESMMRLSKNRFECNTFTDSNNEIVFSAVFAFDEPEIHLHPYMQRTLTKYLCAIANGEDKDFNMLIKEYFGIDRLSAQIIIVTHSPSIISPDYKTLVRFGMNDSGNQAISNGLTMVVEDFEKKHLIALFDSIKEAFFSRGAIVVEGPTEVAVLQRFALKLGIDLDSFGIVIISAGGKGTIPAVCKLLSDFRLPVWSIKDRDEGASTLTGNFTTTNERDFESEVIENMFKESCQDMFIEMLKAYDSRQRGRTIQSKQLAKKAKKYHPELFSGFSFVDNNFEGQRFDGKFSDDALTRLMMYCWLISQKGVILGSEIGDRLPVGAIPDCYRDIIEKAAGLKI